MKLRAFEAILQTSKRNGVRAWRKPGKHALSCAAAACIATAGASAWASDIPYIGVQFIGHGAALTASESAGVVLQDNWNTDSNTPLSGLTNASGSATSVGFTAATLDDDYQTNSGNASYNADLLSTQFGVYLSYGGNPTYSFTSVPSGNYDLYVYTATNFTGQEVEMSLSTGSTTGPTDLFDDEQGTTYAGFVGVTDTTYNSADVGNYIEFTNVSPNGSGAIVLTEINHANGGGEGITAMQLATIVPEPSLLALACLPAIGLLRRRRCVGRADR